MLGTIELEDLRVPKKPREWYELGGSSCIPIVFRPSTWRIKHFDCSVSQIDSDLGSLTCCSSKHWHAGYHRVRASTPTVDLKSSCHRKLDTIEPTSPHWSQYQSITSCALEWIRSVSPWTQCWEALTTSSAFPKSVSRVAANHSGEWKS